MPTIKHGGDSIIVWDCLGSNNAGDIVKIDRIMAKEVYLNIFRNHVIPSASWIIGEPFIFKVDNAFLKTL